MCSPDLFANIKDFSVDIFDQLLSDKHNPINITMNVNNSKTDKQKPNNVNETNSIVDKVKWDDSRRKEYEKGFDMNKIYIVDSNIDTMVTNVTTRDGVEDISKKLNVIFLEPAKNVGMCKSFNSSSKSKKPKDNNPWFNNSCKNSKNNYWKYKKSLSKNTNLTENATLKNLGNQHKKLIRQVKRKYDKDFNTRLKLLKTSNPGEYWRIINNGKKRVKWGTST